MTLCIAAISENGTAVVGLADRMLTVGDMLEYEPREQKIIIITASIFIMLAVDMSLQSEIILEVKRIVNEASAKEWSVREIAEIYNQTANEIHTKKQRDIILMRYGLTSETFISWQSGMQAIFVNRIAKEIKDISEPPPIEAIIAGVDSSGAHIFKKDGYSFECADFSGYATIGNGGWLAEAELTRIAYAKFVGVAQSAFLCYMAKKSGEKASGVGKYTDIVFTTENHIAFFPESLLLELHNNYAKMKQTEHKTQVRFLTKWYEYVKSHEKQIETTNENGESIEDTSTIDEGNI